MTTKTKRPKTAKKPRKGRKPHQQPAPIRLGRLGQVIPTSDHNRTERLRKEARAVIRENLARIEGRKPKAPVQHSEQGKPNGRLSGLDAAVQVLTAAKQPMRCQDIVNTMLAKKLWSTSGRTPAATLHAAMIREIAAKGKDARFRKVDRGLFAVSK